MKKKLPILLIVPHGGYRVPDELAPYSSISPQNLFLLADTCANDIFAMDGAFSAVMRAEISSLFIDLDRRHTEVTSRHNGVIKKVTPYDRSIYLEEYFPDEIAITNLLRRYYLPFHEALAAHLASGNVKLVIQAHTMMAVGPPRAPDAGKPRPLVLLENHVEGAKGAKETCAPAMARGLQSCLEKAFSREKESVAGRITLSEEEVQGSILEKFAGKIPGIRVSLSKSLFLNQRYADIDAMTVSPKRIEALRAAMLGAFEEFYARYAR